MQVKLRSKLGKVLRMSENTDKPWFVRPITGIGINLWAPEWYDASIRKFDAEKVASAVARTGASVALTFQGFSQDHFGVYCCPTELGPVHKNLQEGRDHLGEYVEALHRRNIKAFAYYSFWADRVLWERNPDWRQRDAEGNDIPGGNFGYLCTNSPYRDLALARIREIALNYEVDGFLIDMLEMSANPMGCYCTYCQRKFRERFGRDLPRPPQAYDEDWLRFVHWRYDCHEELMVELRNAVVETRPGCVFMHNSFTLREERDGWAGGHDYEHITQYDDVVTSLPGIGDTQFRHTDEKWKTGLLTRYLRGISNRPVLMQVNRGPYSRDYQTLPVRELKLNVYGSVVAGGSPAYIDNLFPDGSVDERAYDHMAEALQEVKGKVEYLDYDEELPFAALLFSQRSEEYWGLAYPGERKYGLSFEGAYKALLEGHIPFQIIGELGVTSDNLTKFKVLVIPAGVVLDDAQVEAIAAFARGGGALVATAGTALIDGEGRARSNFGLSDVFGVDYLSTVNYHISFIKSTEHPICNGIDPRESIPHWGGYQIKVVPHDGVEVVANVALPVTEIAAGVRVFSWTQNPDVPAGETTSYPAVVASSVGDGRCVFFTGDVTGVYGVYGYPSLRKLFLEAVRWSCKRQIPLEVDGPLCLETSCFRQGNRFVIHLLNHNKTSLRGTAVTGGAMIEGGLPCRDVGIRLSLGGRTPSRVYLAPSREDVPYDLREGRVEMNVPEIDIHQLVVVDCGDVHA